MSRSLVYSTNARDASSQLPIIVVDSTCLPDEGPLPDPDSLLTKHLEQFPSKTPFMIVFFASRAPKTPQMGWLRRLHALLSRDFKKRIQRIYVVHAKWYTKALNKALTPIVSPKFANKLVFMNNLAELSHYLDITLIDINPKVYIDDLDRTQAFEVGMIPVPKQANSIFGSGITTEPTTYWKAAFTFLCRANIDAPVFAPVSRMPDSEYELVHVLIHAVAREQRLRLWDYGPAVVLAVLKEYMLSLPHPIVHLRQLPLPLVDDMDYTRSVLRNTQPAHLQHLSDLANFCRDLKPVIDPVLMAKSLGPAILGMRNPKKEGFAIATRFFRNVIEHWPRAMAGSPPRRPPKPLREVSGEAQQPIITSRPPLDEENEAPPMLSKLDQLSSLYPRGRSLRDLPSEVVTSTKPHPKIPNRKASGRVAEIMKLYDENYLL